MLLQIASRGASTTPEAEQISFDGASTILDFIRVNPSESISNGGGWHYLATGICAFVFQLKPITAKRWCFLTPCMAEAFSWYPFFYKYAVCLKNVCNAPKLLLSLRFRAFMERVPNGVPIKYI